MSGNDFKMTGVSEGDLPTTPSNDGKDDTPQDLEGDISQARDFSLLKPCKSLQNILT